MAQPPRLVRESFDAMPDGQPEAIRLAELLSSGYVLLADDGDGDGEGALVTLTPAGQQAAARLEEAREAGIDRLMTGWEPDRHPELRRLLGHVTRRLVATDRAPEPGPAAGTAA